MYLALFIAVRFACIDWPAEGRSTRKYEGLKQYKHATRSCDCFGNTLKADPGLVESLKKAHACAQANAIGVFLCREEKRAAGQHELESTLVHSETAIDPKNRALQTRGQSGSSTVKLIVSAS